jgi:hypothetical protein
MRTSMSFLKIIENFCLQDPQKKLKSKFFYSQKVGYSAEKIHAI